MAKHHPDLVMCRKQPGVAIGRLCEKCDGKCVICDSFVNPKTLVHICDECNYGSFEGRCVVCGGQGVTDAFYCRECVQMERDRDGCPKIVNLGATKMDVYTMILGTGKFYSVGSKKGMENSMICLNYDSRCKEKAIFTCLEA